ncbi:DgyrCDS1268 [Dimorphilus gyrociliatus]|uniref:DgyrCDS1268 n=1 Tax=Dimorphilus gyrociliatus TaxID=2664684 RepID=A0A7I8V719_9ANNE|nr:DgyrCDS1268 [Dimorphilus gyrociliatus]
MKVLSISIKLLLTYFTCIQVINSTITLKDDEIIAKIDDFINGLLQCRNVPGLSLGIVRNGKTFLTKGYGVRNIESGEPLTEYTKFNIASITKSFVASTLAKIFQDREDIGFSTPIRDILGQSFYLSDSCRTKSITLKDALSHRTGLPRNDVIRFSTMDKDDLIFRLRYLDFTKDFRDSYMYNNLMYILSAHVIEAIQDNGKSWEEATKDFIFRPLNMTDTTFVTDRSDWDKYATGYGKRSKAENKEIDFEMVNNAYNTSTGPGGIGSNAVDMVKYIKFHLSNGRNENGEEVVKEESFLKIRDPVVPTQPQGNTDLGDGLIVWSAIQYGMGLVRGYNRGYQTILHGGSQGGYLSQVELVPKLKNGVFVSSNANGDTGALHVQATTFINDLLATGAPWLNLSIACESSKSTDNSQKNIRDTLLEDNRQHFSTKRSRFVKQDNQIYTGQYGNFAYGNITIYEENQDLFLSYGPILKYKLEPFPFEHIFFCQGQGIYWNANTVAEFRNIRDNKATEVLTLLEPNSPPVFVRDRLMSEAPAPPEPCELEYFFQDDEKLSNCYFVLLSLSNLPNVTTNISKDLVTKSSTEATTTESATSQNQREMTISPNSTEATTDTGVTGVFSSPSPTSLNSTVTESTDDNVTDSNTVPTESYSTDRTPQSPISISSSTVSESTVTNTELSTESVTTESPSESPIDKKGKKKMLSPDKKEKSRKALLAVVISFVFVAIIAVVVGVIIMKHRKKQYSNLGDDSCVQFTNPLHSNFQDAAAVPTNQSSEEKHAVRFGKYNN